MLSVLISARTHSRSRLGLIWRISTKVSMTRIGQGVAIEAMLIGTRIYFLLLIEVGMHEIM